MDSVQGTHCPGRMMAGHVSFARHAKETISRPKDNGKPLKGFKLGNDFFDDQILILERAFSSSEKEGSKTEGRETS